MRQVLRFLQCVAFTTVLPALFLGAQVQGAEVVKVYLHGGRVLNGEVDPRTDDDTLWLRFRYSSLQLSSSYAWSRVEAVRIGQDRMSTEEFRPFAADLAAEQSASHVVPAPAAIVLPRRRQRAQAVDKISSLWATAKLSNWDRDAEMDGLEVCIVPRNSLGEPVRASGQLNITLVDREDQPRRSAQTFPELGRWSKRVDAGDFHDGCAVYRVPFRHIHPQRELTIGSQGLVQLRLNVSGQGVFAAETSVYLRAANRLSSE